MDEISNPYFPMDPDQTLEQGNFVGRKEIWFEKFRHRVHRQPGYRRHLLISGSSGMGKTCLLQKIERQFIEGEGESDNRVLHLNLGRETLRPVKAVLDIWYAVCRKKKKRVDFLQRLANSMEINVGILVEGTVKLGSLVRDRNPQTVDAAFDVLESDLKLRPDSDLILILLDQLGVAAGKAHRDRRSDTQTGLAWQRFFQRLTGLMGVSSHSNSPLLFIGTVRKGRMAQLAEATGDRMTSPNIVEEYPLGPLNEEERRELIIVPAQTQRVQYASSMVDLLLERGGGKPFHLTLACAYVWDWLEQQGRLRLNTALQMTEEELENAIFGGFQGHFWDTLPLDQCTVLKLIAQYQPDRKRLNELGRQEGIQVASAIARQLYNERHFRPLEYAAHESRYTFAYDLFAEFVRAQIPEAERGFPTLRRVLRDALPRLDEAELLNPSQLHEIWRFHDKLELNSREFRRIFESEHEIARSEDWVTHMVKWGESFPEGFIPILIEESESTPEEWTQLKAAEALIKLQRSDKAIPILRRLAGSAEDEQMALQALGLLGELRSTVDILRELAETGANEEVELEAARALQSRGRHKVATCHFVRLACFASDEGIRLEAVRSLQRSGIVAVQPLEKVVEQGAGESVRSEAVAAFKHLGREGKMVLRRLAKHANDDVIRLRAIQSLMHLGVTAGVSSLQHLAQRASDIEVRSESLKTLGEYKKDKEALEALQRLADITENKTLRLELAKSLSKLGDERGLQILTELAQCPNGERIRIGAATALCELGRIRKAVSISVALGCSAESETTMLKAVHTLREVGQSGMTLVHQALTHTDEEYERVCRETVASLRQVARPFLISLLKTREYKGLHLEILGCLTQVAYAEIAATLSDLVRSAQDEEMRERISRYITEAQKVVKEELSTLDGLSQVLSIPTEELGIIADEDIT